MRRQRLRAHVVPKAVRAGLILGRAHQDVDELAQQGAGAFGHIDAFFERANEGLL